MTSINEGLLKLQWLKTYKISLQMALIIVPIDSQRPKTPNWAFTAPQSAKK
jgi:hypothetical protein